MNPTNGGHLVATCFATLNDRSDPLFWPLFSSRRRGGGGRGGVEGEGAVMTDLILYFGLCLLLDFPNGYRGMTQAQNGYHLPASPPAQS